MYLSLLKFKADILLCFMQSGNKTQKLLTQNQFMEEASGCYIYNLPSLTFFHAVNVSALSPWWT